MENKCKRFLSLLLALVMVLGMFPAGHAHAEEAKSFDTIKIDPRTIEGSASCWSDDGKNANPDDAFDGTIDGKGTNDSYWHSNEGDTSKMENGEVYLIGELSQKSKVTKLVYHRRGAARDGNNENGLFNGRVTSCTIYVTEGDVIRSNYVTQNNAELNWVKVAEFTDLENKTANELVFPAPVAAKAVKMVVHTTTNHANNNKIVTCGELEIFKNVCANDAHTYTDCEDTECNDCYATRVAPGHADVDPQDGKCDGCGMDYCAEHNEVPIDAVPATCNTPGWTAGVKCSICGTVITAPTKTDIDPDNHNEVEIPSVAPTYETAGKTAGVECSLCHEVLDPQEVIPAGYNQGIVPNTALTVTAGSAEKLQSEGGPANNHTEGPVRFVLDDNFGTMWHTAYSGNIELSDCWIDFKLDGNYDVTGLRFKGRPSGSNGCIEDYEIWVSYDGENYIKLEGTTAVDQDSNWKDITFANGVQVQNVRLLATRISNSNGNDHKIFAAAIEMRLVGTDSNHTHNFVGEGTDPTLNAAGQKTFTCEGCNTSYTVNYPQLTVKNAQLNSGKVVELSDFEYTLIAGSEDGKWGLAHGGNYYVQVGANGATIPQRIGYNANLTIAPYAEGSTYVTINGAGSDDNSGYLYFGTVNGELSWNRHSNPEAQCAIALYEKDENSTDANIPGYKMVAAGALQEGHKYLIAGQENGVWYVMAPVNSTNKLDHVAKIVSAEPSHTHEYRDEITTPATCTTTGLLTKTCTDTTCGHVHKEIISVNAYAHAWGEPVFTWNGDKATATVTCRNDADHVQTLAGVAVTSTSTTGDCQTNVVTTYTATVTFDGVEYTDTKEVTGNVNSAKHTGEPAYCDNENGTHTSYYDCCDAVIATVSHSFTNYVPDNNATFDDNGTETGTCVCGATDTREVAGSKLVAVAEADGEKFATLQEAVDSDAMMVYLLADVELTERLDISGEVSLELNGHTISGDVEGAYGMIYVKQYAMLTIGGEGSIIANKTHAIGNYGWVNVHGGNIVTNADESYAALYNFYYQPDYYGISNIHDGSLDSVFNCGNLHVYGGHVAYLDNSGDMDVRGGQIDKIYARDGSDAPGLGGAGTISIADPTNITVPEGFKLVKIGERVYVVVAVTYVAEINGTKYATFEAALDVANEGDTITLLAPVVITQDTTLDLTGKTLNGNGVYPAIRVMEKATLTINGGNYTNSDYLFTLGASNASSEGYLVINGGSFMAETTVASVTMGTLTVNGGTFECAAGEYGATYMLNCVDQYFDAGSAKIVVTGGTFVGFNPMKNTAEGVGTNFVAKDYCSRETAGSWTVYADHAYDAGVYTEATFDADGYTTYTCACGHSYTVTAEGTKKVAVAHIGGTRFESLAAAVAAAKSGDIIGLSVDTTEDIVMDQAGVTLSLNGHTLYGQIKVNAANVTVNMGKIYAANKDAIVIGVKDNVNSDVSLTAGGLKVTSETDCAVLIYDGSATFNNCELISNSTSYAAIQGSGTQFGNINLGGGSVTSANEVAIYWPHVGTLTTSGGTITGTTGLYIKQGTANLSGTKIIATGAQVAHTTNGNGGDSTGDAITVDTGATAPEVTMEGVNLNSANSNLVGIYGGTVTLIGTNLEATRDAFRIDAGKLNIKDGSLTAGECVVYIRGGDVVIENGGLTSTSTKYAAIQGNGNCGGNLTINNGSIRNDKNVGIYWPGSGSLTVNGGSINGTTGIYAKQGNVTITGGTIRGTGEKADYNYNGNGGNSTGDALVLESCNYGTLTANITGGTFESRKAEAVAAYAQNGHTELTGFVSGGTFSTKVEESYCAEGYIPTEKDQEGKYSVKLGTYVAEANGTKYETLAEAVAVGGEVKLLANVTLNAYLNVTNNVTLNLNGHNIIRDGGTAIYVDGGMLTINGAGNISGLQAVWANSGKVVINNGTFHGNGVTVYTSGTGYVEIYGGKFSADKDNGDTKNEYTVLNKMDSARDTSAIVVYGGTFVGFNPANNYSEGANTNFVAEGYCSRETDGSWTVVKGHIPGTPVQENFVDSDLNNEGSYDMVTYCSVESCGVKLESKHFVVPVKDGAAAAVNGHKYATFAEAWSKAQAGDTVTLLADLALSEILVINKGITLDGNGKKLTSTAARAINIETTGTVEIKNLTINAGERAVNIINQPATVVLNVVTATAKNNAAYIATSAGAAKLTINESDLTGLAVVNVAGAGAQVAIKNTKITNVDATNSESYGAITVWTSAEKAKVTVTGGKIVVADDSKKAYVFPADADVTGTDDVHYIVATIGDAGFETLAGAVKAAKAGDTITLIRDVNLSEILTIDKAITLDGNGKILTSSAGRAINVETKGKVVISNLTINAGERAVNIINQPATVELNKVTATANNNAAYIATSAGAVNLTISDSNLTGLAVVNVAGAGAQVAIDNTKITNVDATNSENYGAITVWTSAEKAKVTVTGGEIVVAGDSKPAYVFPGNATVTGIDDVHYIVATVGDAGFETLTEAVSYAKAGETITMVRPAVITEGTTIDLAGKKLDGNGVYPAIRVQNGVTLTIMGGEFVNEGDYLFTLGSADKTQAGNLIINGGSFKAMTTVASVTMGTLTVNGGSFECFAGEYGADFMLNCYDANYKNGTAQIIVNGGSFVGFNPAANAAEGANTNFVAEGYISVEDNGVYTVVEAKTVTWYNEDGETVLFELTVPASEVVNADRYEGKTPTKAEDEQYTYEFEAWVEFKDGFKATYTATEKKPDLFKIAGATMTLGNTLDMNFFVNNTDLVDGAYAVITKTFADGRENVVVKSTEWTTYALYPTMKYVSLSDLSAKEMTDTITVVVYDAQGNAISEVWTDSMKDYAMRLIKQQEAAKTPNQEYLTFAVDMLNYGAAAQKAFNYNTEDLANADLTAAQQAYATANTTNENKQVKDEKIVGATLLLQNSIQLNFIYKTSDITEGMYAVATYTNHRGTKKTVDISDDQFGKVDKDGVYTYIPVADTAIADCRQLITLTVYNADGTVFSTATDSVESYCARINSNDALYTEIMKLADSAYALFH